ncbi:MAG: hypothetical protein ABH952_11150 [Candidatus Omnitrophota bacterium]
MPVLTPCNKALPSTGPEDVDSNQSPVEPDIRPIDMPVLTPDNKPLPPMVKDQPIAIVITDANDPTKENIVNVTPQQKEYVHTAIIADFGLFAKYYQPNLSNPINP